MHQPPQHVFVLVILRGRDLLNPPSPPVQRRQEPRPCHLQRLKNMASRVLVQRLSRNPLHQRSQDNKIDVAVGKLRPRRVLRCLCKRHPISRFLPFPRRFEIQVRRQPRVVREQLPHRDVFFSILRKLRQILRYRIVQPHLALFHQLHHSRSCNNHLGQRRQIKNRVQCHRLAPRLQCTLAVGLAIDHLPVMPDQQDSARNGPVMHRPLDDRVNRAHSRCGNRMLRVRRCVCRRRDRQKSAANHRHDDAEGP